MFGDNPNHFGFIVGLIMSSSPMNMSFKVIFTKYF